MKANRRGATFGKAWYLKPREGVTPWQRQMKLVQFNLRPFKRQMRQFVSGVTLAWGRLKDLVEPFMRKEQQEQKDYALAGPSDG